MMFELLLNTAKLILSKDARDGTNALFDALRRSPEWSKDICSLVARVPKSDQERFRLLIDVVVDRLKQLSYDGHCRRSFRTCASELFANVVEHPNSIADPIDVTIELSPTYASIAVKNPKNSPIDLEAWLKQTGDSLKSSTIQSRGRGLHLIKAHADSLEQVETHTIKAVLYRDRVRIVHVTLDEDHVFGVLSGMRNPSLGSRLVTEIQKSGVSRFVVCLDPNEYRRLIFGEEDVFTVRTLGADLTESPVDNDEPDSPITTVVTYIIARGLANSATTFRMVLSDEKMIDLLPQGFAFTKIDAAIQSLHAENG